MWMPPPGGLRHPEHPLSSPSQPCLTLPGTQTHMSSFPSQPSELRIFPGASVDSCPVSSHPTGGLQSQPWLMISSILVPSLSTSSCAVVSQSPSSACEPSATHSNQSQQLSKSALQRHCLCPSAALPGATAAGEQLESLFSVGCIRGITHFNLNSGCQGVVGL